MTESSPSSTTRVDGPEDSTYTPTEGLQRTVAVGVAWKFSSQLIREGTRLAVGVILARLLTPDEWGIAGMAFAVAGFLYIVAEPVIGAALVQRNTITERDRSTAFWMSVALGSAICVLGVGFSGSLAGFFGEPEVQPLFAALSVGFLISALGSVPDALLARELAYRSLELRQIAGTLAGASVAIPVAFAGGGSWAIVANSLAATTTSTVLLWKFCTWRPTRTVSLRSMRDIGGFGLSVLASHFLLYVQVGVDKVLVGRSLGSSALGTYAFAFNLMYTPILNVAYPLNGVLFPALATIQGDPPRLVSAWLRAKRLAVAVMAPTFLTVLIVGPDLIPVVFGSKWDGAIPLLQLLCLAGVAQSLGTFNGVFLITLGRSRRLLTLMFIAAVATTFAVVVGLAWGIVGVAVAYAVAQWALVPVDTWLTTRGGPGSFGQTLRATCASLPAAAGAAIVGVGVRRGLVEIGAPDAIRLAFVAVVMFLAYLLLIWISAPSMRAELRSSLTRFRDRGTR